MLSTNAVMTGSVDWIYVGKFFWVGEIHWLPTLLGWQLPTLLPRFPRLSRHVQFAELEFSSVRAL